MRLSRAVLYASVPLFAFVFAGFVLANRGSARVPLQVLLLPPLTATPDASEAQISGAVRNPGIYPLSRGERVSDLISAAGGLRPEADLDRVDEARRVADGDHVLIPLLGTPGPTATLVRINHASQDELATLPGVNLSQAAAITGSVRRVGPLQNAGDLVSRKLMTPEQAAQLTGLVDWSP